MGHWKARRTRHAALLRGTWVSPYYKAWGVGERRMEGPGMMIVAIPMGAGGEPR